MFVMYSTFIKEKGSSKIKYCTQLKMDVMSILTVRSIKSYVKYSKTHNNSLQNVDLVLTNTRKKYLNTMPEDK